MAIVLTVVHGEPTAGLWCPKCSLPSGFEVPLYSLSNQGVSQFSTVRKCYDCGVPLGAEQ